MALSDLGFSESQERIYLVFLDEPKATTARVAELVGSAEDRVRGDLAALVELGVGKLDESYPSGIVLMLPAAALGQLIERTEDKLHRSVRRVGDTRADVVELSARFARRMTPRSGTAEVGRLDTLDEVRDALEELSFFTRTSVYAVQPGGPLSADALTASRQLDLRGLRRGIDMRIIYHVAVLDDQTNRDYLHELEDAGAQLRVTNDTVEQMIIMDERVAVIPIDPSNSQRGALVIRQARLLAGLLQLYHRLWAEAERIPWPDRDNEADPELSEVELRVLELLASGSTDETSAREVAVSVRHFRRRVAVLMDRLGAATRFEAGAEATRRGWI